MFATEKALHKLVLREIDNFRNMVKLTLVFSQRDPIAQHHEAAVRWIYNLIFKAIFLYTLFISFL